MTKEKREQLEHEMTVMLAGYLCEKSWSVYTRDVWLDRLSRYHGDVAVFALQHVDKLFLNRPPNLVEVEFVAELAVEFGEHACALALTCWPQWATEDDPEEDGEQFMLMIRRFVKHAQIMMRAAREKTACQTSPA